jgi:hypothetical protein
LIIKINYQFIKDFLGSGVAGIIDLRMYIGLTLIHWGARIQTGLEELN